MTKKNEQSLRLPKPGHRAPGGTYIDTGRAWEHFIDVDTPTDATTPASTPSDSSSASTSD